MKRKLFILFLAMLYSFSNEAQLTLTQSNTSYIPGLITANGADTLNFVMPLAGANKQWNYGNLLPAASTSWNYILPANAAFPNATFAELNLSAVIVPNRYYYYDSYSQTSAAGVNNLGYVVNMQRYGIGSMTGNNADSMIFLNQHYAYALPSYLLKFPTTMSSSWQTVLRSYVNFELTINAYSLLNTPCRKVTNTVRLDTVIGWGKMRVPSTGGVSLNYDVLMLKRTVEQKDSFYLAGNPAPATLLTAFGLSQGQTTITNRYIFYRANANYPLLLVNFGSNNFTAPSSIYYDGSALVDPTYIDENDINKDFGIYPNPNSGDFIIKGIELSNEISDLSIYNTLGQLVFEKKLNSFISNSEKINIDNLKPGTYIVSIISQTHKYTSRMIVK